MRRIFFAAVLSLSLTLPAFCAESGDTSAQAEAERAAKSAKPGSYEDWCPEHQVPESLDTRCTPALIPAFKATKDWCPEHGLPESQCLKCNPKLKIVRPPKPAGAK
jgi:hypothetical protein